MRKIIVFSMITLDGVIQGPGGPKEDTSGGFKYGGWTAPYMDPAYEKVLQDELRPADYILGRKTYNIWVDYWPYHADIWPGINEGTKYVLSKKLKRSDPKIKGWAHSVVIRNAGDIKKIKKTEGKDLHVWGSSELVQLLLKNDLVDEIRLKIHPITLGKGKKLFDDAAIPAAFKLIDSIITTKGVIIATYERDGNVKTGDASAM